MLYRCFLAFLSYIFQDTEVVEEEEGEGKKKGEEGEKEKKIEGESDDEEEDKEESDEEKENHEVSARTECLYLTSIYVTNKLLLLTI